MLQLKFNQTFGCFPFRLPLLQQINAGILDVEPALTMSAEKALERPNKSRREAFSDSYFTNIALVQFYSKMLMEKLVFFSKITQVYTVAVRKDCGLKNSASQILAC